MLTYRKLLILALQGALVVCTYYCSFLLRFDFSLPPAMRAVFLETLGIVVEVKLLALVYFDLDSGWWRYVGMSDVWDITKASLLSSGVISLFVTFVTRPAGYPRSLYVIDFILTIVVIAGARVLVRSYTEDLKRETAQKVTLIAGAGQAGKELVRQLNQNPDLDYNVIGFVDDDPTKLGVRIHGKKVLGSIDKLRELIERYGIQCVLIAIPSATGRTVEQIVSNCRSAKVEFKILQALGTRLNGHNSSSRQVSNLRLEHLLGRPPVRLEVGKISSKLQGKVLLVTGAGGSIGSELCRQVAKFNPKKLVLFERSENDLFKISMELSATFPSLTFVPIVGDILDVGALREAFAMHRPSSVFHAAAYKHVPMMEMNCFQAVTNNVLGTYNVALVARQFEAEDFVHISTDKAVNPSNIMGVTKRVSELVILALQDQQTRFVALRFGNVLGSNGSVVPIFERQIANGGPVLVTHPDATRYFMTIPEAVQLVLQASTMGHGGEIFILKMGDQVPIVKLAHNLIRLSGYEPGKDIKIVFTGLRPGEKLVEELLLEQEGVLATSHEDVCVLNGGTVDFRRLRKSLDDLARIVETKNVDALVAKLREIVPEYTPSEEILALCEVDKHDLTSKFRHASSLLLSSDAVDAVA
jgi:FlaA1/EpsC-like NDP-sugar epimerase